MVNSTPLKFNSNPSFIFIVFDSIFLEHSIEPSINLNSTNKSSLFKSSGSFSFFLLFSFKISANFFSSSSVNIGSSCFAPKPKKKLKYPPLFFDFFSSIFLSLKSCSMILSDHVHNNSISIQLIIFFNKYSSSSTSIL